jgi:hypothetical protein
MSQSSRQAKIISEHRGGYSHTDVPFIRLRGRWLEQAGFEIGDKVKVEVEAGRLVITQTPAESA